MYENIWILTQFSPSRPLSFPLFHFRWSSLYPLPPQICFVSFLLLFFMLFKGSSFRSPWLPSLSSISTTSITLLRSSSSPLQGFLLIKKISASSPTPINILTSYQPYIVYVLSFTTFLLQKIKFSSVVWDVGPNCWN